ncbi:hypothetical protein Huta_2059 [Halorhabdus utahensis DSM 12940]|uniref:Zinc-hook domain-containing protein n=1 Tax=Halorhabdus utahensis (strain DSM 12940 / JCM 11049 / AX-2) TaxID=519442 RepID=C7NTN6_HALUD|nr:hypothetical protein [Halorhabdus utahensis]ACV12226.1 hypothetical protein Huta_2059 [Halorhabdus utahensis DSM 12940]
MTDERTRLRRKREELDAELSALGAALDGMEVSTDAMDDAIAAATEARDTATDAFLPADRLPETVTADTRGVVASYLDSIGELRDVRSDEVELTDDRLQAEAKRATDARADIEEISAALDRIGERIDEAETTVADAREDLDDARSRFRDDLAVLGARLERFDIALSPESLGAVTDDRLPERKAEMRASVERIEERVVDLTTRQSTLATERDELQSIDGGGSCPTCNQTVGSDRTASEVEAIEEELGQIEHRLETARREREELLAGIEELEELRGTAISLRSLRSETVAAAAGRVEDREANLADLRADHQEARSERAEAKAERTRADATVATLEIERAGLEADIDRLGAKTDKGATCLDAFELVEDLQAELETRVEERSAQQAAYEETEAERASIDVELEALTDD